MASQITFNQWPNGIWSADFATVGYWLHVQQFSTVRSMVAFQPIFRLYMSPEFATGGQTVEFCSRWRCAIVRDFGTLSKNLFIVVCPIMTFQ